MDRTRDYSSDPNGGFGLSLLAKQKEDSSHQVLPVIGDFSGGIGVPWHPWLPLLFLYHPPVHMLFSPCVSG